MNKSQFLLYTSLGIMISGGLPTNVVYEASDVDKKNQKALLNVYSQRNDSLSTYTVVSQIVPKKDYRSRYAKFVKSKSFLDAYSGKSLGDFMRIEY